MLRVKVKGVDNLTFSTRLSKIFIHIPIYYALNIFWILKKNWNVKCVLLAKLLPSSCSYFAKTCSPSPLSSVSCNFFLTLPLTAYRILWLLRGGGILKSSLKYLGRSHFGLYIAIDHLLPWTYKGHMPKFRLKSQKFEICKFWDDEIF